jgi:hypothetical protein
MEYYDINFDRALNYNELSSFEPGIAALTSIRPPNSNIIHHM